MDERKVKILLVRRARKPFVGQWILPGGAVYNDESVDAAARRELKEKTGLKNIYPVRNRTQTQAPAISNGVYLEQFHVFGKPKRDPRKRMVAIAYLALVDRNKVSVLQKTPKTLNAAWHDIEKLPGLAFDHGEIIKEAVKKLRKKLIDSNIALALLPKQFTLPELQRLYEIILGREIDRRNFRRKFLKLGLIKKTDKKTVGTLYRPANYYSFALGGYREIDIF